MPRLLNTTVISTTWFARTSFETRLTSQLYVAPARFRIFKTIVPRLTTFGENVSTPGRLKPLVGGAHIVERTTAGVVADDAEAACPDESMLTAAAAATIASLDVRAASLPPGRGLTPMCTVTLSCCVGPSCKGAGH